ncbi:unnamed protein product [Boreogadus saida]
MTEKVVVLVKLRHKTSLLPERSGAEAYITEQPHDLVVSGSCLKCLLPTDLYQDEILATDGGPCPVTFLIHGGFLLIPEKLKGRTHRSLFRTSTGAPRSLRVLAPTNPPSGSLPGESEEDEDELDHDANLVSSPFS